MSSEPIQLLFNIPTTVHLFETNLGSIIIDQYEDILHNSSCIRGSLGILS
jgi:hypothetical protein